jgi:hypothetical protein
MLQKAIESVLSLGFVAAGSAAVGYTYGAVI